MCRQTPYENESLLAHNVWQKHAVLLRINTGTNYTGRKSIERACTEGKRSLNDIISERRAFACYLPCDGSS